MLWPRITPFEISEIQSLRTLAGQGDHGLDSFITPPGEIEQQQRLLTLRA
jgi:hypothetical protein